LPVVAGFFSGTGILKAVRVILVTASLTAAAFFTLGLRIDLSGPSSGSWVDARNFPVGASGFVMANNIRGNMYNTYTWGGYLLWRLAPGRKVFIDGRNLSPENFDIAEVIEKADPDEREMTGVPMWKSLLKAYNVDYMILPYAEPDGAARRLLLAVSDDRDWVPVFADPISAVFVKNSPVNADLIRRYAVTGGPFTDVLIGICDGMIKANPAGVKPYITKGDLYLSRGRFDDALKAYGKATEMAPLNVTAKQRLLMVQQGRRPAAQ
jgi:hypothetical protein